MQKNKSTETEVKPRNKITWKKNEYNKENCHFILNKLIHLIKIK